MLDLPRAPILIALLNRVRSSFYSDQWVRYTAIGPNKDKYPEHIKRPIRRLTDRFDGGRK